MKLSKFFHFSIFKNIFILLLFFCFNLTAGEYWRPPMMGLHSLKKNQDDRYSGFLGSTLDVTIFFKSLDNKGFNLQKHRKVRDKYLAALELSVDTLFAESEYVVKEGEVKAHKEKIFTFYLNYCYALIIDSKDKIVMHHGYSTNRPNFEKMPLKKLTYPFHVSLIRLHCYKTK